jgi:hypothetical protein
MTSGQKTAQKVLGYGCLLPLALLVMIALFGACLGPSDPGPANKPPKKQQTATVSVPTKKVTASPKPSPVKVKPRATRAKKPSPTLTFQQPEVPYANCSEVRSAGEAPLYRGQPGYSSRLDRDNDGIACDR